jgi:integrating conjugative element protein (TIGR03749 family)
VLGTPPSRAPAAKPLPPRAADTNRRGAKHAADEKSTRAEPTTATERLVWDKSPLQIALGIGPDQERSITFPAQMHIGVPPDVAPSLRVQTVSRTSYVTALAPFARTRVVAEDRATGSVILLDLTASRSNSVTQPIQIVVPTTAAADSASDDDGGTAPVDMVAMTRFAAQQMYAPRRLRGPHPAIRRVMVEQTPLDSLYAGGGVRGTPMAQWRGDGFYVTAVVLQNLQPQPVELDPLDVRGRWRAITFQHGRLLGKGSEADTTVVYLVCDRPFDACR